MTIKQILQRLSPANLELLEYAREQGITNMLVTYAPGRWVGVNILPEVMPRLRVEQTAGIYAEGEFIDA